MDSYVGVIGSSPGYSRRLADAMNARRDVGHIAVAFKNTEELETFLQSKKLSVLLSDNEEHSEFLKDSGVFCLLTSEPDTEPQDTEHQSIFKFQSASAIIKSVILLNPENKKQINHVFTVFSPANNAAAYEYSCTLAKKLAMEGKTLFLSWELFGGMGREEEVDCKKTISDLLFVARKNEKGMKNLLTGLPSKDGYDYFCGTEYYADLWQYSPEEMAVLMTLCRKYGLYENIVFCCGFMSEGTEALMEASDEIYLVSCSGEETGKRTAEFLRQMKYAGKQTILSKAKEVRV